LQMVSDDYDFILIDCPPSLGILTINGLVAAQKIIIPVQCEYYALEGLSQLLRTILLVKEHISPHVDVMGAVLTMHDKRNKLSHNANITRWKGCRNCFVPFFWSKSISARMSMSWERC